MPLDDDAADADIDADARIRAGTGARAAAGADADPIRLHSREDGDPTGAPVVLVHSLGTDLRVWDEVVARLPRAFRTLRVDLRGHGRSPCPAPPYTLDALVDDVERCLDRAGLAGATVVGLSIGGMIAQSLAHRRPDLVGALVLSNTASSLGEPAMWRERVQRIAEHGLEASAEPILERWFGRAFRESPAAAPTVALWRERLRRTPVAGYVGCCAAIAGADLAATSAALRLPTLGIAGGEDGACPPERVAATVATIAGARLEILDGAGHLPCVEAPAAYAALLTAFVEEQRGA